MYQMINFIVSSELINAFLPCTATNRVNYLDEEISDKATVSSNALVDVLPIEDKYSDR